MLSRILRRALFIAAFAVAAIVSGPPLAAAQTGQGGATVTPDAGPENSTFTVSATGFKPNTPVEATIDGFAISSGAGTADGSGNATVNFTGFSAGTHLVRVEGITPSDAPHGPSAVFSVRKAPCTQNCQGLPPTGDDMRGLALAGGVLILAGVYFATRNKVQGKHFKGAARVAGAAVLVAAAATALLDTADPEPAAAAGTASIAGRATNASNSAGVPNVCVHAVNASDHGTAITDSNGNYTITNLAAGTYNVGFVHCSATPTFFNEYFGGARSWNQATAVTVADGQAVTGRDVTLDPGAVAVGRVTQAAGGAGAPDVCVHFGQTNDTIGGCAVVSRDNGVFFSPVLNLNGQYIVVYRDFQFEFAIRYQGGTNDAPSSTKMTFTPGQQTSGLGVALPAAGSIQGTITDAATDDAPTRTVCVGDYSANVATFASAFVNDDGTYSIDQVGPGPHKVRFFDCESGGTPYRTEFYNDKATVESADPVDLTAGQDRTGVDAEMSTQDNGSTTSTTSGGSTTSTTSGGSTTSTTSGGSTTSTTSGGSTTSTTSGGSTTSTTSGGSTTSTTARATTTTGAGATTSTTSATPPPANGPATSSASSARPGDPVTLSGSGFRPGSTVSAVIYSTPVKLGETTADAGGTAKITVRIPANTSPGQHELQLQGVDPSGSSRVLAARISIGTLPRTGGLAPWQSAAGAAAVLLAALALAGRRRLIRFDA